MTTKKGSARLKVPADNTMSIPRRASGSPSFLRFPVVRSLAVLAAIALGGSTEAVPAAEPSGGAGRERPNVILILADDVSAGEYALYGGTGIVTPQLDALAGEGLHFRTAWAAPLCGPARAMLLSGRYNEHTGMASNAGRRQDLLANPTLGTLMRRAGYATGIFGKLHHGGAPESYGFDEYCICRIWDGYSGSPQRSYARAGMYAIHWYWHPGLVANGVGIPTTAENFGPEIVSGHILDFITRHKDRPFFVLWTAHLPHHEFVEKTGGWARPDVPELDENFAPTGKRVPASLASNLAYLDGKLGGIRRHLQTLGIAERTIMIYTADNGTADKPPDKGVPQRSVAVRVPFVVGGGGVPALGARDEMTDFTDVLPTLLDLAGAEIPAGIDGRSFAPLLRGGSFTGREWIHSSGGLQHEYRGKTGQWTRDRRWLLDADGRLWDCADHRDPNRYRAVPAGAPGAADTIRRLKALGPKFPVNSPTDP
jgi:arylsulfatase A